MEKLAVGPRSALRFCDPASAIRSNASVACGTRRLQPPSRTQRGFAGQGAARVGFGDQATLVRNQRQSW